MARKKFIESDVLSFRDSYAVPSIKRLPRRIQYKFDEYLKENRLAQIAWLSTSDNGYLSVSFLGNKITKEQFLGMLNHSYNIA